MVNIDTAYRQIDYAKDLYENGFDFPSKQKNIIAMRVLCFYLRDELNMKPKQREEFLYSYYEKYKKDYNKVLDYRDIDRVLDYVVKKKISLRQIEQITIKQSELNYLESLDFPLKEKKILFALLCDYKLDCEKAKGNKSTYIISDSVVKFSQIKNQANITFSRGQRIEDFLKCFAEKGLLSFTPKLNVVANFIENIQYVENDQEYRITTFSDYGLQWEKLNGNKTIRQCKDCGKIYRAKKDARLDYNKCAECAKEIEREKTRNRVEKLRKK